MAYKLYTRTGDDGSTTLFGGRKVSKSDRRVSCYGDVDELNSWLGYVISQSKHSDVNQVLDRIQKELFVIQASLSNPEISGPQIEQGSIDWLEKNCDLFDQKNSELTEFILPGGGLLGSSLHLARTVCRRAERQVVALSQVAPINPLTIKYLNRLSDLLFALARQINQIEGFSEVHPDYS